MVLEKRQTLKVLLVMIALALFFIQVASASSNCPTCKVVYDDESATTGSHAASDTLYPLVLLNPSSGNFMHNDQVNLASVVLTML
jgi:hypothetical protein